MNSGLISGTETVKARRRVRNSFLEKLSFRRNNSCVILNGLLPRKISSYRDSFHVFKSSHPKEMTLYGWEPYAIQNSRRLREAHCCDRQSHITDKLYFIVRKLYRMSRTLKLLALPDLPSLKFVKRTFQRLSQLQTFLGDFNFLQTFSEQQTKGQIVLRKLRELQLFFHRACSCQDMKTWSLSGRDGLTLNTFVHSQKLQILRCENISVATWNSFCKKCKFPSLRGLVLNMATKLTSRAFDFQLLCDFLETSKEPEMEYLVLLVGSDRITNYQELLGLKKHFKMLKIDLSRQCQYSNTRYGLSESAAPNLACDQLIFRTCNAADGEFFRKLEQCGQSKDAHLFFTNSHSKWEHFNDILTEQFSNLRSLSFQPFYPRTFWRHAFFTVIA
jgi:hypothetical protein